jgi:hypothetical protein
MSIQIIFFIGVAVFGVFFAPFQARLANQILKKI